MFVLPGQIGYALVPMIARGIMLGPDQPIILHMLDIEPAAEALKGVKMELIDAAFPLLKGSSFDSEGYRDRNQISVVAKTFMDFVGNRAQQVLLPQRMLSRLVKVSTLRLWSVDSLAKKE